MILHKLSEYAESVEEYPPIHFEYRELDWMIEVEEGRVDFIPLKEVSKEFLYAENIVRRSGLKVLPRLLGDKVGYVLGEPDKACADEFEKDFSRRKFKSFYELVRECYEKTGVEKLKDVLLLKEKRSNLEIPEEMNAGDWLGIRVEGEYLLNKSEIQNYWQKKQNEVAGERSDLTAKCLICGEKKTIADRHPEKIQMQSFGGQGSGNTLVSANENAFESYGLKASYIAPVCFGCGMKYGRAANHLLNHDETEFNRVRAGGIVYIFWRQNPKEKDLGIGRLVSSPEETEVKSFIESYKSGSKREISTEDFYILALNANDARAVVKDWIVTTFENVNRNLVRYFGSMRIGQNPRYYGLQTLAVSTAFDFDRIKSTVVESLVSYALAGAPLNYSVLQNVIRRNKVEAGGKDGSSWKAVSHARAVLLKMFFNSQQGGDFQVKSTLNKNEKDGAYLCGRLFAVIERIQTLAVPGIKSTVVDKYYGTASTAPASVFGNLIRKAQNHLAKLRKEEKRKGAYYGLQKEMEEIMKDLDDFPAYLSLQEQGKFALGYYQQRGYRPVQNENEKEQG